MRFAASGQQPDEPMHEPEAWHQPVGEPHMDDAALRSVLERALQQPARMPACESNSVDLMTPPKKVIVPRTPFVRHFLGHKMSGACFGRQWPAYATASATGSRFRSARSRHLHKLCGAGFECQPEPFDRRCSGSGYRYRSALLGFRYRHSCSRCQSGPCQDGNSRTGPEPFGNQGAEALFREVASDSWRCSSPSRHRELHLSATLRVSMSAAPPPLPHPTLTSRAIRTFSSGTNCSPTWTRTPKHRACRNEGLLEALCAGPCHQGRRLAQCCLCR